MRSCGPVLDRREELEMTRPTNHSTNRRRSSTVAVQTAVATEPMSCDDILAAFERFDGVYKRDAVTAAVARKDEITPRLIAILEEIRADPARFTGDDEYFVHNYAAILLGHFGERRAHRPIVELFGMPHGIDRIFGDLLTEDLPWILFNTCDDGGRLIESLVLKRDAYDYCRTSAMRALVYLVAGGQKPRDEVLSFFGSLFTGDEADFSSHFWSGLASAMHRLCPKEQMHVIEKAYEDELIEPFFICREDFEDGLKRGEDAALKDVRHDMGCRMPDDVHKHMSWWACLNERKPATGHTAPVAVAPGTKPKKRKDARKRQKAARKQGRRWR
jgi:hypothetical protein